MRAIEKGAYVLKDCDGTPDAIIIGTGTEVELADAGGGHPRRPGQKVRVVSMPSMDVFDAQDAAYKEAVLPDAVKARVAVEAGVSNLWPKYVGMHGKVIGVDTFGESAPAGDVYKEFGFTAEPSPRRQQPPLTGASRGTAERGQTGARPIPPRATVFSTHLFTPSEENSNDDESWYQRLRPHRPYGLPRDLARISRRHRSGRHQRPAGPDYLAYMLKYDSVHGNFQGDIAVDGNSMIVNGKTIRLTAERTRPT
jgi:hypothetical protein